MHHRLASSVAALAFVSLGGGISVADAAVTVLGNGLAGLCSKAANSASNGSTFDTTQAIIVCGLAIDHDALSTRDRAGTYVNRGILFLARSAFRDAKKDFDTALYLDPTIGEAYVNRGAALIGEHRFAEGLTEIDRGLTMGPEQPEKAYFNRGLAHEYLDDLKNAYLDYTKAAELKPDWDEPKKQLASFTLTPRGKSAP